MKILIISGRSHMHIGGGETYNRHLITALKSQKHKILEIPCITSNIKEITSSNRLCTINNNFSNL